MRFVRLILRGYRMAIINHEEALQLANINPEGSNLARAYIDLRMLLESHLAYGIDANLIIELENRGISNG